MIGLVGLKEAVEGLENGVDTWCTAELFSQGQWQLLSVARAAVAGPAILLLDEITANLDAETEQNVLMALKKVSKDRTVISISHRMIEQINQTKERDAGENDKGETTDNKKQYSTEESDRAAGTKRDSEWNCTYHYRRVLVGDCRSIRKIHI